MDGHLRNFLLPHTYIYFPDMTLEQRVSQLEAAAERPCSGCTRLTQQLTDLQQRIADLEEHRGLPSPPHADTPDVCTIDNPDIDELMEQVRQISHGHIDDDLADLFTLHSDEEDSAATSTKGRLEDQEPPEPAGALPQPATVSEQRSVSLIGESLPEVTSMSPPAERVPLRPEG